MVSRKTRTIAASTVLAGLTGCGSNKTVEDAKSFDSSGQKLTVDAREATVRIEDGGSGKVEARSGGDSAAVALPKGKETHRVDGASAEGIATDPNSIRTVSVSASDGRARVITAAREGAGPCSN